MSNIITYKEKENSVLSLINPSKMDWSMIVTDTLRTGLEAKNANYSLYFPDEIKELMINQVADKMIMLDYKSVLDKNNSNMVRDVKKNQSSSFLSLCYLLADYILKASNKPIKEGSLNLIPREIATVLFSEFDKPDENGYWSGLRINEMLFMVRKGLNGEFKTDKTYTHLNAELINTWIRLYKHERFKYIETKQVQRKEKRYSKELIKQNYNNLLAK